MAYAVHHERVPASGFEHGAAVQLTAADVGDACAWPEHRGALQCHVVLARDNMLRVYEVRAKDGAKLVHVRQHRLLGEVTGLCAVRTMASHVDGRERLLVSFRDAKMALLEWDDEHGDVNVVSLHTFERAEVLRRGLPPAFVPRLRADPSSRCAALLLPHDTLAVLPLHQDATDLGLDDVRDPAALSHAPYAPSFLLHLTEDVDASLRNVRDAVFLPGLQKPTVALLYEPQLTWTGSLSRARQTTRVGLVTLDVPLGSYPLTVTSAWLPYDALYLVACPAELGGVLVVTPSMLLHLDATARIVGTSVSAWAPLTSDDMPGVVAAPHHELDLQNSTLAFEDATTALLVVASGDMYSVHINVDGRSVTGITLRRGSIDVPRTAPAAFLVRLPASHWLCGATLTDSTLYVLDAHAETHAAPAADAAVDDDDFDLYGDAAQPATTSTSITARWTRCDAIPTLAPLDAIAVGPTRGADGGVRTRTVVAMHDHLGVLEPRLPCTEPRSIAPAQDVWSGAARDDVWMVAGSQDGSLLYALHGHDATFVAQLPERTLACACASASESANAGAALVRVTPTCVEVRAAADGAVRATHRPRDGVLIERASLAESYVALAWSDGRATVARLDGDAYVLLGEIADAVGVDVWLDARATLGVTAAVTGLAADGRWSLYALPSLQRLWSSASLPTLPSRLGETPPLGDAAAADSAARLSVALYKLCLVGDVPTLVVQYTNGQLAVWEALRTPAPTAPGTLALDFVRVDAYMLSAPCQSLTPLTLDGRACVAAAGAHPVVLVRDRVGPLVFLEPDVPLASVAPLPDDGAAAAVVDGNAALLAWEPCALDAAVPYTRWTTGRTYTHVAVHDETACIVAASVQPAPYVLYDDQAQPVRDPAQDPTPAMAARGALELFARVGEPPVHGYELAPCEVVTALHMAPLDTLERGSGRRTYLAVGTTTALGEDRSAQGHMYVFELAEYVPHAGETAPGDAMRLRLLCREEMRAPVTALCDLNGFLVAGVGQKLLVRSLEFSEWMVTIAFLDIGLYTTSLQRVKNLLLLTDYHRSASFVAFQEDPARLVLLGRDYGTACTEHGALLLDRAKCTIVTCDTHGTLRLLDYQPSNPTSLGGQRLLLRTEYHTPSSAAHAVMLPGPRLAASGECFTSEVLVAKRNGALDILVPVNARVFPALQLLQSQLVRMVRHAAGLHPRAFRAVPNDATPRPLAKGILDGTLLHATECMSRVKLARLVDELRARTGGVVADDLLRCLVHLQPHW